MTKAVLFSACLATITGMMTAQVQIDKPIQLTGSDGDRSITYLEAPVNGTDAVNKDYVDAAVAATGGSDVPSMISSESGTSYTYSAAVQYCDGLSEGGFTDWRMPTESDIQFFAGIAGATSNYLWTKTRSSIDYAANQNFVSVKLDDGSWRNGDEMLMPVDMRVQTTTGYNQTPWSVTATITPSIPGNWLKVTQLSITTKSGYSRIKYNFPNGTSAYSPTYSYLSTGSSVTMQWANTDTPILVTSIDIEGYAYYSSSYPHYDILAVNGFEIVPFQKTGATLKTRCVR